MHASCETTIYKSMLFICNCINRKIGKKMWKQELKVVDAGAVHQKWKQRLKVKFLPVVIDVIWVSNTGGIVLVFV